MRVLCFLTPISTKIRATSVWEYTPAENCVVDIIIGAHRERKRQSRRDDPKSFYNVAPSPRERVSRVAVLGCARQLLLFLIVAGELDEITKGNRLDHGDIWQVKRLIAT